MSYSSQKPVQYALKAKNADVALEAIASISASLAVSASTAADGVKGISFLNPNITIIKEDNTTVSTSLITLVPTNASTASYVDGGKF
jgi:hypothetical protein